MRLVWGYAWPHRDRRAVVDLAVTREPNAYEDKECAWKHVCRYKSEEDRIQKRVSAVNDGVEMHKVESVSGDLVGKPEGPKDRWSRSVSELLLRQCSTCLRALQ